jgi:nucleoside-diphosphate-sugar epimerase
MTLAPDAAQNALRGLRVLVTGGLGLIGKPTVALLREKGAHVTILDRPGAAATDSEGLTTGDICDQTLVRKLIGGVDAVVHLAGIPGPDLVDSLTTYRVNTVGTFTVLETAAMAGLKKAVYASSINASGLPLNAHPVLPSFYPVDENEPADVSDSYSLSKRANEDAARMLNRRWGLPLTGLRFPLVRDITENGGRTFGAHIRKVMADDPRRAACEGWSYLHTGDAARAVVAALTHDTPPAPGILVAAPNTFLAYPTADAIARYAAEVPHKPIEGRQVGLDLTLAERHMGFTAETLLDHVAPEQLIGTTDDEDGARDHG